MYQKFIENSAIIFNIKIGYFKYKTDRNSFNKILKNLPKIHIESDDLFVHIKDGYIFRTSIGWSYT